MIDVMGLFNGYEQVWYSAEQRKLMTAKNMRSLRQKSGLSQKQLSEMLGVSPQTYNGYETGKYEPNVEILIRLCFLYNVDMDYMVSRWTGVDENREAESIIENEAQNDSVDMISIELHQMEKRLNEFQKEFSDLQNRAKEKKAK